jgi:hypothetical protein
MDEPIYFDTITVANGMVNTACSRCGALIVDWPKDRGGFVSERPNQDRHRFWHESNEGTSLEGDDGY